MKPCGETKTLKVKVLASMRSAFTTYNSFDDDGRETSVLLRLQHTFEIACFHYRQVRRPTYKYCWTRNTARLRQCSTLESVAV